MGAESIAQMDEVKAVTQLRKPDRVEVLDISLLDTPMKDKSDFVNTIGSPDSVLSARPQENSSEVSNEVDSKSAEETSANSNGIDNVNTGTSTSSEVTTKDVDRGVEADAKPTTTGVAPREVQPAALEVKEDIHEEDSVVKRDDAPEVPVSTAESPVKVSIANEIQEMEEISLEEDSEQSNPVEKGISAPELQLGVDNSKLVKISNQQTNTVIVLQTSTSALQPRTDDFDAARGNSKHSTTVVKEDQTLEPQPSIAELKMAEQSIKEVAELHVKTGVRKAADRTEREEKLAVLAASAIESLPASRFARASEIQEASEPATPPTPERSGTVIKLTRQMSRVSTGMGPMSRVSTGMGPISPRFEIRAAKEIQELHEKVKSLEEELRRKAAVIENQDFNQKEKESELLNKIECLELANEQLLQGGNDSSIQLQMELTRLQRQNSVLQLRERELQFQINTQEMIKTQMLDKRPAKSEPTNPIKELESKVAILESKLAEAVEVSNMYKIQLHEAFSRQKSVQSAALLNLGDGEDILKELQRLRKQTKEQEAEMMDIQDRFFIISVRLAEAAAQKEELLSKLKRIQGSK